MRGYLVGVICGVAAVAGMAGGAGALDAVDIRHPEARKALARAEQDKRKAEQAYRQELIGIQRTLISELEQAKRDAMHRESLDDANAIQQAIEAAKQELDRLEGKPVVQTFEIDATKSWQPTVEVQKGQTITIRARGTWTHYTVRKPYDGDGWVDPRNTDRRGALFGRIGDREFPVGKATRFPAPENGVLELRMNDSNHSDNAGSLTVLIEVQ